MTSRLSPSKQFYLSLLLLIIAVNCISQEYPLITENKIWSNYVTEYSAKKYPLYASHFIRIDTVISNGAILIVLHSERT